MSYVYMKHKSFVTDKLCIVAHPDDEVLWGGANLLVESGWKVIVATNKKNPVRQAEFNKTMVLAGVYETAIHQSIPCQHVISQRHYKRLQKRNGNS